MKWQFGEVWHTERFRAPGRRVFAGVRADVELKRRLKVRRTYCVVGAGIQRICRD